MRGIKIEWRIHKYHIQTDTHADTHTDTQTNRQSDFLSSWSEPKRWQEGAWYDMNDVKLMNCFALKLEWNGTYTEVMNREQTLHLQYKAGRFKGLRDWGIFLFLVGLLELLGTALCSLSRLRKTMLVLFTFSRLLRSFHVLYSSGWTDMCSQTQTNQFQVDRWPLYKSALLSVLIWSNNIFPLQIP